MAIARQRIHLPPGGWRRAISGLITGTLWNGAEVDRLERAFADLFPIRIDHTLAGFGQDFAACFVVTDRANCPPEGGGEIAVVGAK